jgi:hypothetical protein
MTQAEVEAIVRGIVPILRRHVEEHVAKATAAIRIENKELQRFVDQLAEMLTDPGVKP